MIINEEDRKIIKTWKSYIDNGHYGNSRDIVDMYNKVFEGVRQKQPYTTCGSCLRRCVKLMYEELVRQETDEQNKLQALQEIDEFMTEEEHKEEKPKRGRQKKS